MTDRHTQIDDYLAGKLDAKAKEQFEHEMENDPGLASEVTLFRDMAAALAPSGEDDLRVNLERLGRKYTPAESRRRWWIPGALLFLLFLGWGIWKWLFTEAPPALPPAPALPKSVPPSGPVAGRNETPVTAPKTDAAKTQRILAASFRPNPKIESLIGTQFRGEIYRFTLNEPPANGRLKKKGDNAIFRLSGTIKTSAETAALPSFRVLLFGNRPADYEQLRPHFTQELPVEKAGDSLLFRLEKELKLPPGLYYFLIEDPGTGMIYHAGKVTLLN